MRAIRAFLLQELKPFLKITLFKLGDPVILFKGVPIIIDDPALLPCLTYDQVGDLSLGSRIGLELLSYLFDQIEASPFNLLRDSVNLIHAQLPNIERLLLV